MHESGTTYAAPKTDVRTTCGQCIAGCGIRIDAGGRAYGDPDDPLSRGYLCANGRASLSMIGHPSRLARPAVHGETASWDQALATAATGIRRAIEAGGPDAVGLYFGAGDPAGSLAFLASAGLLQGLGSSRHFNVIAMEATHRNVAAEAMFGDPLLVPRADLERARGALVLGTNPPVTNDEAGLAASLHRLIRDGGALVVMDPRRTEIARRATVHLQLRPGTDAEVLLAMLHVVLSEGRTIRDLRTSTRNADALQRLAAQVPPARAASVADVPERQIVRAARKLAQLGPVTMLSRLGVAMSRRATINEWLAWAFVGCLGGFGSEGGLVHNAGFIDFHAMMRRNRAPPDSILGVLPPTQLPDAVLRDDSQRMRALIVVAADPLESLPDRARTERAFAHLETLIALDVAPTDTTERATVSLPCAHHLEKEDASLLLPDRKPRRHAHLSKPAATPPGEARSEVAILSDLARRLNVPLFGTKAIDTAARAASTGGGNHERPINPRGVFRTVIPLLTRFELTRVRLARGHGGAEKGKLDPSEFVCAVQKTIGRIDIAPRRFVDAMESSLDTPVDHSEELTLSTCVRSRHFINGKTRILGRSANRAELRLAKPDAAARQLGDGDEAVVRTRIATLHVEVRVDTSLRPGFATMAFGTPGLNRLTDATDRDPLSGIPALANVPCRVHRKEER